MNIVALQKNLEMMPDQALATYMQRPSGEVPQYLVLSELNRRKKLRDSSAAMGAAAQAPKSTVRDDLLNQGLGAIPAASPGAEQAYAAGGLVSFADGGGVGDEMGYAGYNYPGFGQFTPEQIEQARAFDAQRAAEQQAYLEANPEAAADLAGLQSLWGKTKDVASAVGSKLGDVATLIPRTVATGINQMARVPRALGVNVPQIPGSFDVAALQGKGAPAPAAAGKQKDLFDTISKATGKGEEVSTPPAPTPRARPSAAPSAGGIGSLSAAARVRGPGVGGGSAGAGTGDTTYKPVTIEEQIANAKKIQDSLGVPDEFKEDRARLEEERSALAGRKQDNINQAMIQAGLGMMAGKSQYALQNIGEGGAQGLAFLNKAQQQDDAARRALIAEQNALTKAQAMMRRGDQQTAISLVNSAEKDRQFAVTAAQQKENYLLAHQDRMAQINATLQAASMRVSAGGGTKQDMLALKAAQMAEGSAKAWAMANKNNPEYVINPGKYEQDYQAKIAEGYTRAYAVIGRDMPEAVQAPAQPAKQTISFGSLK